MLKTYHPTESELMEMARVALRRRIASPELADTGRPAPQFNRAAALRSIAAPPELTGLVARTGGYWGPRPGAFVKPRYGTPAYALAVKIGWIAAEEEKSDRRAWQERRERSLRTCHRYAPDEPRRHEPPRESGAYVPQLSARLENDLNLTDGARRCARKIAEFTYRQNRAERCLDTTVTYLMKALGRSRRTVQRYLRILEREGYITVRIIGSRFSRMCVGLVIYLCGPIFARHHRKEWPPEKQRRSTNPGASRESHNQGKFFSLDHYKDRKLMFSVQSWFWRCSNGVFRSLMKTDPLKDLPPVVSG